MYVIYVVDTGWLAKFVPSIVLNGLDQIYRILILTISKRGLAGGTWLLKSKSIRPVQRGQNDLEQPILVFLL